jgi:hypothetical protein
MIEPISREFEHAIYHKFSWAKLIANTKNDKIQIERWSEVLGLHGGCIRGAKFIQSAIHFIAPELHARALLSNNPCLTPSTRPFLFLERRHNREPPILHWALSRRSLFFSIARDEEQQAAATLSA